MVKSVVPHKLNTALSALDARLRGVNERLDSIAERVSVPHTYENEWRLNTMLGDARAEIMYSRDKNLAGFVGDAWRYNTLLSEAVSNGYNQEALPPKIDVFESLIEYLSQTPPSAESRRVFVDAMNLWRIGILAKTGDDMARNVAEYNFIIELASSKGYPVDRAYISNESYGEQPSLNLNRYL